MKFNDLLLQFTNSAMRLINSHTPVKFYAIGTNDDKGSVISKFDYDWVDGEARINTTNMLVYKGYIASTFNSERLVYDEYEIVLIQTLIGQIPCIIRNEKYYSYKNKIFKSLKAVYDYKKEHNDE